MLFIYNLFLKRFALYGLFGIFELITKILCTTLISRSFFGGFGTT